MIAAPISICYIETTDYGYVVGDTYMVGGNGGEGSNSMWFTQSSAPLANPMNVYMEGKKIGSGNQSTTKSNPIMY